MALFSKKALDAITAKESASATIHTVMIVDDKAANLSVMAAILRPHYQVIEATDAQEALALIGQHPAPESLACILSDYRMPVVTGVDFLEQVKQTLPHATRVIVTGYIDVDAIIDSINKAEIHKFIVKPFDANDFLAVIASAVKHHENLRAAAGGTQDPAREQALRTIETQRAEIDTLSRELAAVKMKLADIEKAP